MIIIISLILVLDQLTKLIACRSLYLHQSIPVIKNIFHITLVHNRGAAFGLMRNQVPLLIFTTFIAIWLIYVNLKNSPGGKKLSLYRISLGLVLAGALGNLIDRVFCGYVIDFLDFRIWPVFNVADSAITVGAILLGWALLKEPKIK
jgi:signal peptidase II